MDPWTLDPWTQGLWALGQWTLTVSKLVFWSLYPCTPRTVAKRLDEADA